MLGKLDELKFIERFFSISERVKATHDLASFGDEAFPFLEAILSGQAVSKFGVPWRDQGAPLDCALVTCRMIRNAPKSLEALIVECAKDGHAYAQEYCLDHDLDWI